MLRPRVPASAGGVWPVRRIRRPKWLNQIPWFAFGTRANISKYCNEKRLKAKWRAAMDSRFPSAPNSRTLPPEKYSCPSFRQWKRADQLPRSLLNSGSLWCPAERMLMSSLSPSPWRRQRARSPSGMSVHSTASAALSAKSHNLWYSFFLPHLRRHPHLRSVAIKRIKNFSSR